MLSKIFNVLRKIVSEIAGAIVLSVAVVAAFIACFSSEGVMRIVAPVLVFIAAIIVYGLTTSIASKNDR